MRQLFMILTAGLLLAACGSSKKVTTMTPEFNQKWDLKVLNGEEITGNFVNPVYIEFNDAESRVSGSAACNRFFGSFTKSGKSLSFKPLASTKMFCDEASNKLETDFLNSLENVTGYKFEGNQLVLLNGTNEVAKFEESKAVPDELTGTWNLYYITGRRIAFDGLYPEKKPYITFMQGRTNFSSFTGCNSLSGSYNGEKADKMFELGAMTLMACPGEGEMVFMEQLKEVTGYKLEGDTLAFFNKDIEVMKFSKSN